jgi:LmbE family N-acetylglucosaminyl deacetylase
LLVATERHFPILAAVKHLFPPLLPKEALQPPVLAIAAHPDDEVIACGAMLAWHRRQGHPVRVIHCTDGAAGDPHGRYADIAAQRQREGEEALRRLGVDDVVRLGLPDGELPERLDLLEQRLRAELTRAAPRTLYSFFFTEAHRDHRAVARAVARCAGVLMSDTRVLLYGVNQVVCGGIMFDVTGLMDVKQHALAAFESQLTYNDWRSKILGRDHAATVNVEHPSVQHAELFCDLQPSELAATCDAVEAVFRRLLQDGNA